MGHLRSYFPGWKETDHRATAYNKKDQKKNQKEITKNKTIKGINTMKTEFPGHYKRMRNRYKEYLEAVESLGIATKKAGPLETKTCELIQIAAATAVRAEGAVHSHTKRAVAAGATSEEIRHAVIALSNTIGFPQVMAGLTWVDDILD